MDRNVVTATVLIALIMVVWLTWLSPQPTANDPATGRQDSTVVPSEPQEATPEVASPVAPVESAFAAADSMVQGAVEGVARSIFVQTDLYRAELSTKGAAIESWKLSEYRVADGSRPVQMIDTTRSGAISLVFTSPASRVYDTRSFFFETDTEAEEIILADTSTSVRFRARVGDGAIVVTYRFKLGTYEVDYGIEFERPETFMTATGYELVWNGAIPFSEEDHQDEGTRSGAFASSGGEVESVVLTGDPVATKSLRGQVDWVSVKSKYFMAAIIPDAPVLGAELAGERTGIPEDSTMVHDYTVSLVMPFPESPDVSFRAYVGPMEYYRISRYGLGLYDTVDYGWDFFETVTRPLAKYVFIPTFTFLGKWLPNYGLVIIVFSILIKLLVHPLTKSSFTSMAKMRELQPRMEAIKEKFADNPQKQQEAMMKMYKETGVNPLGGCLPMLLQYPIIIALWQFLPQAIEIRQQGFLWAADLSAPDILIGLPFTIPLYGNFVAGFTLLMGISMVIQMRLQAQPSTNPQAKIFMYVFPIMIFAIFNKLASGLNLYYLCYNVLSAGHQQLINRQLAAKREKEESGIEIGGQAKPKRGGSNGQARRSK